MSMKALLGWGTLGEIASFRHSLEKHPLGAQLRLRDTHQRLLRAWRRKWVWSRVSGSRYDRCCWPFDRRIAGVVAGPDGRWLGIVFGLNESWPGRVPVALVGRGVYCKAEAADRPSAVGDKLTTSPTLGHAMKALDPLKAFGSVLGKALKPLKEGTDLIPI